MMIARLTARNTAKALFSEPNSVALNLP